MKLRASIHGFEYKFTLKDLAICANSETCINCQLNEYDSISDEFNCSKGELYRVLIWIAEGNDPDRFTDIQDCNKVDVYENDIAEFDNFQIKATGKIIFVHGLFNIEGRVGIDEPNSLYFLYGQDIKIIGNIHQKAGNN